MVIPGPCSLALRLCGWLLLARLATARTVLHHPWPLLGIVWLLCFVGRRWSQAQISGGQYWAGWCCRRQTDGLFLSDLLSTLFPHAFVLSHAGDHSHHQEPGRHLRGHCHRSGHSALSQALLLYAEYQHIFLDVCLKVFSPLPEFFRGCCPTTRRHHGRRAHWAPNFGNTFLLCLLEQSGTTKSSGPFLGPYTRCTFSERREGHTSLVGLLGSFSLFPADIGGVERLSIHTWSSLWNFLPLTTASLFWREWEASGKIRHFDRLNPCFPTMAPRLSLDYPRVFPLKTPLHTF